MGGRWPHLQKAQRENPGKTMWGETARMVSRVGRTPLVKLREDPVITRWQHEEVETILRV